MDDAELMAFLRSRSDWEDFLYNNPHINDTDYINKVAASGRIFGIKSKMFGNIIPDEIQILGSDYREGFFAKGFNPRQRAIMDRMLDFSFGHEVIDARIHVHEALTPFALFMKGRYARALCSDYSPDNSTVESLYPIPCVDIMASNLPSGKFDAVITLEVLEHVPDIDAALTDMARILKPGGIVLGTFPFDPRVDVTHVKAVIKDGSVVHLETPEYHGNPVDPERGSLVFQIPSWDIIDRAIRAGFSDARIVAILSVPRGIVGQTIGPILVFEAQR